MTAVAERYESLVAEFEALRRDAGAASPAWAARERAFAAFLAAGLPTTRDEEWKFTPVGPIAETAFMRARPVALAVDQLAPLLVPGPGARIVLVNGRLAREHSTLDALPAGVTVTAAAASPDAAALPEPLAAGAFVRLNAAFGDEQIDIRIAPKTVVDEPLHVVSVAAADGPPALLAPRLVVTAGEGAEATIVESHAGAGDAPTLASVVVAIDVGPAAHLRHVKIQRESDLAFHMAASAVRLDRASTFTSTALTFGGRIARNDIVATLAGEGAECTLNGLYVVAGAALADTHTTIDHARPHCPSHEVYKGILAGRARAVFNGKIIVRPQAQKTDAKQTNKALLLTDDAQVNTKPQLEIFADDVKCTHGAAIGQLDEDALFYLRARGIGAAEARAILIHAFAGEVLDGIQAPAVREHAMTLLDGKLAGTRD
jgi:Fe-S cluster assembly protein SufD